MQEPSQEPDREPGTTRLGRYLVAGELGRGAMGVVYRARDPIIDRIVALKTIESGRTGAAAASFTERFFQEARSAGRLSHPNIVTVFDAGEAEGTAYIAMEFLEGTSLREMLDANGTLPVQRAVEIAGQVARGLGYAHENGVVHRDIKPANIIVLRNRRPKITDFGIARLGEDDVLRGERAGSPKYMSPEQIRGDAELDGRSDIFSLGTLLYEMLTGMQPFRGEDVVSIMHSVLSDMPEPPSAHNRRVPPELDAVVLRMLAKRPEDRFPSARWLFRELRQIEEQIAKEGPPDALRPEPSERPATPRVSADDPTLILGPAAPRAASPRRRLLPYAGALAGLAVVCALAWFALRDSAGPPPEPPRAIIAAPPPPIPVEPRAEPVTNEPAPQAPAVEPTSPLKPAAVARRKPASAPAPAPPPPPAPEPEVAAAPEPAPPPPPAPAPPAVARIQIAVSPWGEVYVDGKLLGTSPPLAEIEVAPGRHRLEIRNSAQLPYLTFFDLQAGDTRQIRHRFPN
jgi:predicted Ser/Thr protein kinase